jgi:hypothetical protein
MLAPLLATALLWSPCSDPATTVASAALTAAELPADDKPLKALAAWLKLYRTGKAPLNGKQDDGRPVPIDAKDSFAVKFGLAPKTGLGTSTWAGDLEVILEHVAKLDSAEAAEAILDIASIGIDRGNYEREMGSIEVRGIGEKWLMRLASPAARELLAKAARGELKVEKARAFAVQAAAVRGLGLMREGGAHATIAAQLAAAEVAVRINAAEALGTLIKAPTEEESSRLGRKVDLLDDAGQEAAAVALAGALEREQSDMVLPVVVQSLRALYQKYVPKPGVEAPKKDAAAPAAAPAGLPESVRLAVRAGIKALGRTSWRADMAILALLDEFRSTEAVPALIAVLERFRDHPEEVQSGKLSGLLLYRAHEMLVAMTGAVFPATQPDKWRELWDKERDKIEVTQKKEPKGVPTTVASGFCGIPVQGTRVLFILDLSRSMTFAMDNPPPATKDSPKLSTRLDYAKRELISAMDQIAPNAFFNLITFNGNPKCKVWSKDMVPATEHNRTRFRKYVGELDGEGGTNLWSALEEGLKLKSMVYGNRYETNVDELFVLSDGAPSQGDVLDPAEILRLVKECNRFSGLRINTVFISSNSEEERSQPPMPWMKDIDAAQLMKRMAEENGGKFVKL